MRSASTARQPNIAPRPTPLPASRQMFNPMLHRAETNTGCVCSDGEWHLCTECPETPDCTLPMNQKEAYRRKTRL